MWSDEVCITQRRYPTELGETLPNSLGQNLTYFGAKHASLREKYTLPKNILHVNLSSLRSTDSPKNYTVEYCFAIHFGFSYTMHCTSNQSNGKLQIRKCTLAIPQKNLLCTLYIRCFTRLHFETLTFFFQLAHNNSKIKKNYFFKYLNVFFGLPAERGNLNVSKRALCEMLYV